MSLRRRFFIALASLSCCTLMYSINAQEAPHGPSLFTPEARSKDAATLNRTGARRTAIVSAVDRVKAAVVNIHSERTVASTSSDLFPQAASSRVNGMGTGIIIDPRGYIITNHHVVEDVNLIKIRLSDGTNATAEAVRSGIKGAQAKSKASAVAVQFGGSRTLAPVPGYDAG